MFEKKDGRTNSLSGRLLLVFFSGVVVAVCPSSATAPVSPVGLLFWEQHSACTFFTHYKDMTMTLKMSHSWAEEQQKGCMAFFSPSQLLDIQCKNICRQKRACSTFRCTSRCRGVAETGNGVPILNVTLNEIRQA